MGELTAQVNEAPMIVRHPERQTAFAGEDVRFSVAAVGIEPLSYQWQFRDDDIPGADKPDLLLSSVQIWNSGDYTVVVRNPYGEAASKPAPLRVFSPPVILRQPVGVQAVLNQKVLFRVDAAGTPPLRYQWFRNQQPITGGTNEFLGVDAVQANDSGEYFVHIKNDYGEVFSRSAGLEVNTRPFIIAQPSSKTVRPNGSVTFFVEAGGTPPLRYQWRLNGSFLRHETNASLTIQGATPDDAGAYQVIVANVAGATNSQPAFLKVEIPETIFADKLAESVLVSNATACVSGHNLQATPEPGEPNHANRVGGSSVWIRWRASQRGIVTFSTRGSSFDTVLAAYTMAASGGGLVPVAADDDTDAFFASEIRFVANSNMVYHIAIDGVDGVEGQITLCWSLTTSPFEVLPIIQQQPADLTASFNETVRFQVGAMGDNLRYQWFFNDTLLTNEIRPTLTISNVTPLHAGVYYVRVFQGNQWVRSRLATLQFSFVTVDNFPTNGFARDHFKDVVIRPLTLLNGFAEVGMASSEAAGASVSGASVVLGYTGTQIFNTHGSGSEAGEIAHCGVPGGASQWFLFQAPADGTLYLNTEGSNFDTILAVYQGPGPLLSSLSVVECDNNSGAGNASSLNLPATENSVYYIAVDGVNGATGLANLNYRLLVPVTLTRVSRPDEETTRFRVTGTPLYPITIERSAGMATWNQAGTTNVPSSGFFPFEDITASGAKRFYRAFQSP